MKLFNRDYKKIDEVKIPEGRGCPDIILHKSVLYYYNERDGMFIEADTYDTDKQE